MLLSVMFAALQAAPTVTPPSAPTASPKADAQIEEVAADPYANMDQFTLYVWTDRNGVRHYTDDPKRAPKGVNPSVVYSDRPATSVAKPEIKTEAAPPTNQE